jgi:polar amino acid transport system substrate-binding protein
MRQILQSRGGDIVLRDVPSPACEPGGVLVQTMYSLISSGTERANVESARQSLLSRARSRPDLVREVIQRTRREGIGATRRSIMQKLSEERAIGYSCAGRVVEVGEHARNLHAGQIVACAGGGHANHAEFVNVPANLCVPVPPSVAPEAAALTTVAAIALHGVRLSGPVLGERVAVIGCGLVGQIVCRLLASAGVEVFAVDLDGRRAEMARRGGADHAFVVSAATRDEILARTDGLGVDHALVTAASKSNAPLLLAAELARDRGSLVVVGDVPIEVPRGPMYSKELRLRVSRSYGPGRYDPEYEERGLDYPVGYVRWTERRNMQAVLDLQARDRLRLDDMIEIVVPIERAPEAYARLVDAPEQQPMGAIVLSYGAESATDRMPTTLEAGIPNCQPLVTPDMAGDGQVRVGLIGPGGFATRILVPALQSAGARLQVVGGGSGPSARAAQRSGFARVVEGENELLHASDVDAIVIATRHASHARLATAALQSGKHVFCEKPLALTGDELTAVLNAAANADRILAVGFNRRFAPGFTRLRDFIRLPGRRVTSIYRVSAGRIPADAWVHDLVQGGGRALGEACHFVDTLTALTGSRVARVYASGYTADGLPLQATDNLAITLSFADGSVGEIVYIADGSREVAKERLECFCGDRTGVLDDFRMLHLHGPRTDSSDLGQPDKGHAAEIAAFLDGIRTGSQPVPLDEIAGVSWATLAIVESLRTGLPVALR